MDPYVFEPLSRYFNVIHWSFCAAPLQVEHTYSVGKGAMLGGSIASSFSPAQKNPDHENGENLFNGLTQQLSTI